MLHLSNYLISNLLLMRINYLFNGRIVKFIQQLDQASINRNDFVYMMTRGMLISDLAQVQCSTYSIYINICSISTSDAIGCLLYCTCACMLAGWTLGQKPN